MLRLYCWRSTTVEALLLFCLIGLLCCACCCATVDQIVLMCNTITAVGKGASADDVGGRLGGSCPDIYIGA